MHLSSHRVLSQYPYLGSSLVLTFGSWDQNGKWRLWGIAVRELLEGGDSSHLGSGLDGIRHERTSFNGIISHDHPINKLLNIATSLRSIWSEEKQFCLFYSLEMEDIAGDHNFHTHTHTFSSPPPRPTPQNTTDKTQRTKYQVKNNVPRQSSVLPLSALPVSYLPSHQTGLCELCRITLLDRPLHTHTQLTNIKNIWSRLTGRSGRRLAS